MDEIKPSAHGMQDDSEGKSNEKEADPGAESGAQASDAKPLIPIVAPVALSVPIKERKTEQTGIHTQQREEHLTPKPDNPPERMRPAEKQLNIITAIIAIATIVNIAVFYFESEDTSKKMETLSMKAGEIIGTMNTALSNSQDAIKKAFDANKKAVQASEQQAGKALNASIALAHNEQRAWVIFPHKYGLVDFVANGPITYSAGFLNTGKTPADAVEGIVRAEIVSDRGEPSLTYESGTSNTFRLGELVPNDDEPPAKLQARAEHMPIVISTERLRRIQLGHEYMAIYGQVTYRDVAGNHWMRFCKEVNTAAPKEEQEAPQKCEKYNSSGDGKAPPTVR